LFIAFVLVFALFAAIRPIRDQKKATEASFPFWEIKDLRGPNHPISPLRHRGQRDYNFFPLSGDTGNGKQDLLSNPASLGVG